MKGLQHDEQGHNHKNTIKQYKNTTKTWLSTTRTLINAQKLRLWVGKPCDPLQNLYHPKHNSLYVDLQKNDTWHYRALCNIYNAVCE